MDERQQFLEIYNKYRNPGNDSSDDESANVWALLKQDTHMDVNIGDKVYLKTGDLQGTIGKILNIESNQ